MKVANMIKIIGLCNDKHESNGKDVCRLGFLRQTTPNVQSYEIIASLGSTGLFKTWGRRYAQKKILGVPVSFWGLTIDGCNYKSIRDILKSGISFQSLDISTNNSTNVQYHVSVNIITFFNAIMYIKMGHNKEHFCHYFIALIRKNGCQSSSIRLRNLFWVWSIS